MKKDLKYYLELNYPTEIIKIPADEGGGYSACIPQLGRFAFISDGETTEDALNNIEALKKEYFAHMLENGIPIPEPVDMDEQAFSGKFLVRVPKDLHRTIVQNAKKNNISLNQYCQYLITLGLTNSLFDEAIGNTNTKSEKAASNSIVFKFDFESKAIYPEYRYPKLKLIHNDKLQEYLNAG